MIKNGKGYIVAVDFDGTVVDDAYPNVGQDAPYAAETLRALQDAGCRIILWTMRHGQGLEDAIQWFNRKGIKLFGVNHNPEQDEWTDSPKAHAQLYIDDRGFNTPMKQPYGFRSRVVDWDRVYGTLFEDDKLI